MANTIIAKFQAEGLGQFTSEVNNASTQMEMFDKAQKIVNQTTSDLTKKQLELREAISSQGGIMIALKNKGLEQGKLYQDLKLKLDANIKSFEAETAAIKKGVSEKKKLILEEGNYKKILDQVANSEITAREASKLLKQELVQLGLQGKQNTKEYLELKNVAGELTGAIGDTSDEIKQAGSDTRGLDKALRVATTLTAGFGLVEGATALFGKENENLQKTLVKVNGLMIAMNSLQQIQEELKKKDSVFTALQTKAQQLYNVAVGQSTGALKLLRVAMLGLGIGAVIAGLYLLVTNWQKIKDAVTGTTDAMRENARISKLNADTRREAADSIKGEVANIYELVAVAKNENLTRTDRQHAIDELQKKYPDYLKNISLETIGTDATSKAIQAQIELLTQREQIKKLADKRAELSNKLLDNEAIDQQFSAYEKVKIFLAKALSGKNEDGSRDDAGNYDLQGVLTTARSRVKTEIQKQIDDIDAQFGQILGKIGKSNISVFDASKNGVQTKAQNQTKVVLNELEKLKKELEKKKKELEDKVSFNVVKGLDSESGGVVKIRTEITGLEQQIQTIENIITNKKIKPLELQIKAYEGFEVELKKQIEEATKQFDDLFNLELLLGNDIADNPALQKQVDKIKELQAELDKLRKTYNSYFEEVKEQETLSNVPIIEITEQKIRLSKLEYEQKKKDAENFRNENLISEQEYNEELKKLAQQRLQTLQENTSKAQNIYSEVMNVVGQITDTISQATQQRTANEIAQLEEKKNKGLISERQYQKEKEKIEKEQALREWRIATSKAFLQIPMVILNALTSVPFPANIALAAIYGAIATAQAAIVAKNKPKFRYGGSVAEVFKGSGYVKGKSHEQGGVNAELEGNEYVFRREAVAKYGVANLDKLNKGLLKPDIFNIPQINYSLLKQDSKIVDMSNNFNKLQSKLGEKLEYIYQGIQQGNNERFNLNKQIINKLGKKDGKRT